MNFVYLILVEKRNCNLSHVFITEKYGSWCVRKVALIRISSDLRGRIKRIKKFPSIDISWCLWNREICDTSHNSKKFAHLIFISPSYLKIVAQYWSDLDVLWKFNWRIFSALMIIDGCFIFWFLTLASSEVLNQENLSINRPQNHSYQLVE